MPSLRAPTPGRHGPGSATGAVPPPSLWGFSHVKRYYDPRLGRVAAKIVPGELYVTTADEYVTTILGSCVAACVWDPAAATWCAAG